MHVRRRMCVKQTFLVWWQQQSLPGLAESSFFVRPMSLLLRILMRKQKKNTKRAQTMPFIIAFVFECLKSALRVDFYGKSE